jgi:hypothetical protein
VRTNLTVEDLGDLLDKPLVAVLATLRTDGTVLLCPPASAPSMTGLPGRSGLSFGLRLMN